MNVDRIKETCIYVTDLQATKEFYAGKLGFPVISLVEGRHVFFRAGQSVLLCFVAEKTMMDAELPPHGAKGSVHLAFEAATEAYNESLALITNAGIEVLHQHVWPNKRRSFYFHDPDKNLLEIIEEGLWEEN